MNEVKWCIIHQIFVRLSLYLCVFGSVGVSVCPSVRGCVSVCACVCLSVCLYCLLTCCWCVLLSLGPTWSWSWCTAGGTCVLEGLVRPPSAPVSVSPDPYNYQRTPLLYQLHMVTLHLCHINYICKQPSVTLTTHVTITTLCYTYYTFNHHNPLLH